MAIPESQKITTQVRIMKRTRPKLDSIRTAKDWTFAEAIDRITDFFIANQNKQRQKRAS